jgi:hypothetical protein
VDAARASMLEAISAAEKVRRSPTGQPTVTAPSAATFDGKVGTSVLFPVRSAKPTGDPRVLIDKVAKAWRAKGYAVTSATVGELGFEADAHLPDRGIVIFGLSSTRGKGEMTLDGESGCVPPS